MEIVLHLGAHKTATTYLQALLDRNAGVLKLHSTALALPRRLRPIFNAAPRPRYTTPRGRRVAARAWTLGQMIGSATDLGCERLVISEEQLIGSLRAVADGRGLYRNAGREVAAVSRALGDRPVRVMFSIRSYESFHVSAWGQMLRGAGYREFSADLRRRLLESRRGWPEVLANLTRALPNGSELNIWRYERMGDALPRILSSMLGEDAAREIEPFGGTPLPGPTGAAVDAIEAHMNAHGHAEPEEVLRLLLEFGKEQGYAAYDPWTAEEKSLLRRRYRDDVAFIRQLWPGALICGAPERIPEQHPKEKKTAERPPAFTGNGQRSTRPVQSGVSM